MIALLIRHLRIALLNPCPVSIIIMLFIRVLDQLRNVLICLIELKANIILISDKDVPFHVFQRDYPIDFIQEQTVLILL